WRRADQLCDVRPQCFGINGAPAFIDLDIAPLGPPQLSKHLPKRRETNLRIRITLFASHQHTNAPLPLGLLRARRQRPRRRRSAEERDELAPAHCPVPPVLPTGKIAHSQLRQETAALQYFDAAYDHSGSRTTEVTGARRRRMSALLQLRL